VATVIEGDRVKWVPVTAGRDFGTEVEIVAGLKGDERLITNPPDSLVDGVTVRVVPVPAPAPAGGAAQ
jgi:hypothetical protein